MVNGGEWHGTINNEPRNFGVQLAIDKSEWEFANLLNCFAINELHSFRVNNLP